MSEMAVAFKRHRFSVRDFHRMAEAGLFEPDARLELINGELIEMAPMHEHHAVSLRLVAALLAARLAGRAEIGCQTPVILNDDSEPLPDFTIARLEPRRYLDHHPRPKDILWLIEIADSTRDSDRDIKVPLYASVGIPEVWLVDLVDDAVVVYRDPTTRGYATTSTVNGGDTIAPLAFPDECFSVAEMLPSG